MDNDVSQDWKSTSKFRDKIFETSALRVALDDDKYDSLNYCNAFLHRQASPISIAEDAESRDDVATTTSGSYVVDLCEVDEYCRRHDREIYEDTDV